MRVWGERSLSTIRRLLPYDEENVPPVYGHSVTRLSIWTSRGNRILEAIIQDQRGPIQFQKTFSNVHTAYLLHIFSLITFNLRFAGTIILKTAYGYTVNPEGEDPLVAIAEMNLERFSQSSQPGAWLVDVFPFSGSILTKLSFLVFSYLICV